MSANEVNEDEVFEPLLVTTACELGKHNLCNGEGNVNDDGRGEEELMPCSCPCHANER